MKEQTAIDGAFDYLFWKGNCDIGMLDLKGWYPMRLTSNIQAS